MIMNHQDFGSMHGTQESTVTILATAKLCHPSANPLEERKFTDSLIIFVNLIVSLGKKGD